MISTCCAAGVVAENSPPHLNKGKKVKPETGWNPTASSARQSRTSAGDARDSAPLAGDDGVSVSRNRLPMRRFRYLSLEAIFGVSFSVAAVNEIRRRRALVGPVERDAS